MQQALYGRMLVLVVATGAGCKPPGFFGVLSPPAIGVMVESPANLTLGFIAHVNVTVVLLSALGGCSDTLIINGVFFIPPSASAPIAARSVSRGDIRLI